MKKILAVCLLLLALTTVHMQTALACSGYPYFGVQDLPNMDLLVKATVIDTDDRGFNAVLRIEAYYKGEGNTLLTVMRYPVALASGALVRGYDTSCLYAGRGDQWVKGSQGYFGLRSNSDGTFNDSYYGTAHFYPVDGMITYQEGATEGFAVELDEPITITEAAFIDLLLEAGGRDAPVSPSTDTPQFYPLMRFLNITTANGTRYQVNPDRSLMQLPDDYPLAISPDGSHVAYRTDDGRIAFQYIWTTYQYTQGNTWDRFMIPGDAVRFSNDSSFAVVWDKTQLTIVMPTSLYSSEFGSLFQLKTIAHVDFVHDDSLPLPQVLWSADSSTLVWEDSSGIWRWNILDDALPRQIITTADLEAKFYHFPALLDVSMHGRYIRFGLSDEWSLMDTTTAEIYPNAITSPDERFLVSLNGVPAERPNCVPPLRETCALRLDGSGIASIFPYRAELLGVWHDNGLLTTESWHPAIAETQYSSYRYLGVLISGLRQITYDAQYNQPAMLVGDYQIYFDFYQDEDVAEPENLPYLDILNLEDKVGSPIASIEWGQYVFFDEYRLSTSEYMP